MPFVGHIHYTEQGQGFPLVLLHGHTLDHRMWEDVLPLLTPSFRVITPDLAGHGQSGLSPDGKTLADDLADLLHHLGIREAAVCGVSMGGAAAICFALEYPQMCAALIPVSTALFGRPYTEWPGSRPYVLQARKDGLRPALEAWIADPLFATTRESAAADRFREIVLDFPGLTWLNKTPPLYTTERPIEDRMYEIVCPVLIVVGELDIPEFQRISAWLEGNLPKVQKMVVADTGHLLPMEQPEIFADTILRFLNSALNE